MDMKPVFEYSVTHAYHIGYLNGSGKRAGDFSMKDEAEALAYVKWAEEYKKPVKHVIHNCVSVATSRIALDKHEEMR